MTSEHDSIDEWIGELRRADPDQLGREVHRLVEAVLTNPATADGFPTSVAGARSLPTRALPVDRDGRPYEPSLYDDLEPNELGHATPRKATSVETAALAKATETRRRAAFDRHVVSAYEYLGEAAMALRAAQRHIADAVKAQGGAGKATEPGCACMAEVGAWDEVYRTPLIDGERLPLGRFAYDFYKRNGRLPTDCECRERAAGKRVTPGAVVEQRRTLGPIAAELARGLGLELTPWQQSVLDQVLEVDKRGRLMRRTIVVHQPRSDPGAARLIHALHGYTGATAGYAKEAR